MSVRYSSLGNLARGCRDAKLSRRLFVRTSVVRLGAALAILGAMLAMTLLERMS